MTMKSVDELYMSRCLQLARIGEYYVAPNPMVGAVLVDDMGSVIGEGWHQQYGGPHAEVNAYADARRYMQQHGIKEDFSSLTLYVSLEPCSHWGKTPPCARMVAESHVKRVVIGCLDPNPKVSGQGVAILRDAGIEVCIGVLERECRELNKRFLCLHENHRPYVVLKWAQTADGFLDWQRTDGKALRISTPLMKQLVHQQRAENMAIMVGTRTAVLDNPKLTLSHWSGRNPMRIVPDRHGVIPQDSRIFSSDAQTIVYRECTDWEYILHDLAERNIHSVLVEGGAQLLNSILSSGIYDEVHIEVASFPLPEYKGVRVHGVPAPRYTPHTTPQVIDFHNVYVEYHQCKVN